MKKLQLTIAILFLAVAFSCSSDSESNSSTSKLMKVTVTYPDYILVQNLTYNDDEKIVKAIISKNGSIISTTDYTYNSSGDVEEMFFGTDLKYKFFHNSNRTIQKLEIYKKGNDELYKLLITTVYTYENNKVIGNSVYTSTNSKTRNVSTYDTRGNVTQTAFYVAVTDANPDGTLSPDGIENYSGYDNKKNPTQLLPKEIVFPKVQINNATVKTDNTGTETSVYEYNTEGYVTKETTGTTITTYEYVKN